MEPRKFISPFSSVETYDSCISHLWNRHTQLQKDVESLQNDIIKLELEKARLTHECKAIYRYLETWKKSEAEYRRMAMTLSKQMSSALKILCGTTVCSDGRSIADHMRDAHKKLGLLPEESELKTETNPQQDDKPDESSLFYF